MRTTGPHPLRARELTTPHPEGLTTRLVPVEVDLKQQIFDVCSSLNNGHSPKGRLRQLLLRVSDAGRSQRCGLHRGRRPKAFNEGTRGKLQAVAPRAPRAMEVCAARSCVGATDADGCVG